jgi:hypothetical protein
MSLDVGRSVRIEPSAPSVGRVEAVAMAILVAAGLFLRARGVIVGPVIGVWLDEATWAMRLLERPLVDHLIRPPLFMALTRWSAHVFGNTELAFRLLPWLAGLATPFLAVLLARRAFHTAGARVFFVAVLSLASGPIDFSKEFKPYAIGVAVHVLLPLLAWRWLDRPSAGRLWPVALAAPLALLFCQDVLFLYPGLFLVLGIEALRIQRAGCAAKTAGSARTLLAVVAVCALTAGVVGTMNLVFWRRIPKEKAEVYWADKYDVFYRERPGTASSRLAWTTEKVGAMVAMPGERRQFWSDDWVPAAGVRAARRFDRFLWLGLYGAGLAAIVVGRRWRAGLLFASPLFVCTALNALGHWPLGPSRMNQFAVVGAAAVAAIAFDAILSLLAARAERRRSPIDTDAPPAQGSARGPSGTPPPDAGAAGGRAATAVAPALLLIGLPLVLFERTWNAEKQLAPTTEILRIMEELPARAVVASAPDRDIKGEEKGEGRERLYLDRHACRPYEFYARYHPRGIEAARRLQEVFDVRCEPKARHIFERVADLPPDERVWVILTPGRRSRVPRRWPANLAIITRQHRGWQVVYEAKTR